jgi:hypothetical protein
LHGRSGNLPRSRLRRHTSVYLIGSDIDFQAHVFQGTMVSEFEARECDYAQAPDGAYHCMYASDLNPESKICGTDVLMTLKMQTG